MIIGQDSSVLEGVEKGTDTQEAYCHDPKLANDCRTDILYTIVEKIKSLFHIKKL